MCPPDFCNLFVELSTLRRTTTTTRSSTHGDLYITGAMRRQDSGWEGAGRGRHSERYTDKGGAVLPRPERVWLMGFFSVS